MTFFWYGSTCCLDALDNQLLHFLDARFVALVERPLFDALGPHEPSSQEDLQVFAGGRLAHAELFRDQHAADAILDQIAVHLRPEMPSRAFQPFEDLQAAVVCQRSQNNFCLHIDN